MAEELGISRKTYVLLETARWYPPYKERAHMLKVLHDVSPELAATFLQVTGASLEDHAVVVQTPAAQVLPPSRIAVKAAYAGAVAQVAEEQDLTASAVTKVASAVLAKMVNAGVGDASLASAADAAS
jgi:DNA-binding XRE family transcriptional regulator